MTKKPVKNKVVKKPTKTKKKESPVTWEDLGAFLLLIIIIAGIFWAGRATAAVRMTQDKPPRGEVVKLKDCSDGSISTRHVSPDQDFPYEIGDFFSEGDTTGIAEGRLNFFLHKYVIIAKK